VSAAWAILVDAYRELNARKLFWITLSLSGLVVLVYASIGFDETGLSMFFGLKHIDSEMVREGSPLARMLYRGIFSDFIVGLWLAWIAVILALISTSSIFPDFQAGGSVELVLSKPIGRPRLFLLKYLSSLLFVLLQVAIFCAGVFLCMGWRIGQWEFMIFAAIPMVTLFYSYIYAVNVLVGVITRSALTALLVSMLFWFSVFSLNLTEGLVNRFKLTLAEERSVVSDPDAAAQLEGLTRWHGRIRAVQAVLPKTSETVALVSRWLLEESDISLLDIMAGNVRRNDAGEFVPRRDDPQRRAERRMQEEMETRPVWYVVGTSLIFEGVVLALACLVFTRRDY
jgi:hypothetical protein